jgi:hypothetical protein
MYVDLSFRTLYCGFDGVLRRSSPTIPGTIFFSLCSESCTADAYGALSVRTTIALVFGVMGGLVIVGGVVAVLVSKDLFPCSRQARIGEEIAPPSFPFEEYAAPPFEPQGYSQQEYAPPPDGAEAGLLQGSLPPFLPAVVIGRDLGRSGFPL